MRVASILLDAAVDGATVRMDTLSILEGGRILASAPLSFPPAVNGVTVHPPIKAPVTADGRPSGWVITGQGVPLIQGDVGKDFFIDRKRILPGDTIVISQLKVGIS